ncbi:MAG: hypothetical protein AUH84_00200 [Thaumarchaeota archaeon 13_1_40CM_4_38_7]|nr:MAG: hypothetical protein AUH84_00200 [Thaumarchaeota archaeon 13_1_40CM_4_38_7]
MEQDMGILLNKLNNLVYNMSVSLVGMSDESLRDLSYGIGVLGISVNLSTKTSSIEDSLRNNLKVRPPSPFIENSEPIIDVLDNPDSLKIIALLPGVRKEDVSFNLKEGMVELTIKKSGQIYHREIPCKVRPAEIITKSVNYNNSILEIIFKKKANR